MTYPAVPDLRPFGGTAAPDLTEGGPYSQALEQIEAYLAQLGAYVDAQVAEVRGEIPSSADFATAEQLEVVRTSAEMAASAATAAAEAASAAQGTADEASSSAATLTGYFGSLVTTLNNVSVGEYKLMSGIASDGTGTVTSPSSEAIMEEASSASTVAGEALTDAEASTAKLNNLLNVSAALPGKVTSSGESMTRVTAYPFASDGSEGTLWGLLYNVLANLSLAAPNDDHEQLLGWLGDNADGLTADPAVRSSAALTACYESGGSGSGSSLGVDEQNYLTKDGARVSNLNIGNNDRHIALSTDNSNSDPSITFVLDSESNSPTTVLLSTPSDPDKGKHGQINVRLADDSQWITLDPLSLTNATEALDCAHLIDMKRMEFSKDYGWLPVAPPQ